ncbi:hypothetical protein RHMOL_Rhmol11G0036100 [Rhododendron molle]|uniref:Uncharacterized protein n=1 Tax=Rhododendron molle TaxID=49168 RepID=A0ACC0LPT5_RHOML|nr:hypothetical protein RHMOL_Rhmol11G0036100 [Rhododendron molle]
MLVWISKTTHNESQTSIPGSNPGLPHEEDEEIPTGLQSIGNNDGAVPITQKKLSVKVFKAKSGYLKGLGMRPSSTVRSTIVGSVNNNEYVTHLEKKVDGQDELIQEQGEKIQAQAEGIEAANATIAKLVEAKEQQGRALTSVLEYLKNQGYT